MLAHISTQKGALQYMQLQFLQNLMFAEQAKGKRAMKAIEINNCYAQGLSSSSSPFN